MSTLVAKLNADSLPALCTRHRVKRGCTGEWKWSWAEGVPCDDCAQEEAMRAAIRQRRATKKASLA